MSLTTEDLKKLSEPFDEKTIGIKVQSFSKDRSKAMLVAYAQHTDVAARLDAVDPTWSTRSVAVERLGDIHTVRMQLTVKGVTRENVGDGDDQKSAYSDALKRCAMLFGVGRYLYDAEQVWVEYSEQAHKFKTWTYDDYKKALRAGQAQLPVGQAPTAPKPETKPVAKAAAPAKAPAPTKAPAKPAGPSRGELGTRIQSLTEELQMDGVDLLGIIRERYETDNAKNLGISELQDLITHLTSMVEGARS
jgi:hypothetical protein